MARTTEIIAACVVSAIMGVAAGLAISPGEADAGYQASAKPAPTNLSSKSDMFVTGKPVTVDRRALPKSVEVAEVQKIGDDFILLDAKGRIVYRSERAARTTTVSKNANVPLITGLGVGRVEAAFRQTAD